jgi:hypothetical protein
MRSVDPVIDADRHCIIDSARARREGSLNLVLELSTKVSDTRNLAVIERALAVEIQELFVGPDTIDLSPWPGTGADFNGGPGAPPR